MSAESERSPKRQRRSYSPPSPETKPAFVSHNPHTPPPSVHMSPSWNAQTSTLQQSGTVTFPTPPSTAGFHSHPTGRTSGSEGLDSGKGTPVESSDMSKRDVDGDVTMGGQADAEHRRTDHERQAKDAGTGANAQPALPLFKLLNKPIARQRPHPSEDLFAMYKLRGIQDSVRRFDPVTGEKINKLRKSYEGKLKELGLEGRNKPEKREDGILTNLVDPQWENVMQEGGPTWWTAKHEATNLHGPAREQFLNKVGPALTFKPGKLTKDDHEHWQHALGLDEQAKAQAGANAAAPAKSAAANFLSKTAPVRNSAPASPRAAGPGRATRPGKKRRYDESSYEGYEDDGYSTGGMEDRKRQKRNGTREDPD